MALSFFGVGFIELLMVLFLNGGMSVPLGVPPMPEDPRLAQIAPEDCLFYTAWAGIAKPDPSSPNHTEQLLAEQELQEAIVKVEKAIRDALGKAALAERDEQAARLAQIMPKWAKILLTQPAAIYVTKLEVGGDAIPDVEGAMVLRVGDQADEVAKLIDQMQMGFGAELKVQEVEINESKFNRYTAGEGIPAVTWGIRGNYLLLGVGDKALENLYENMLRNREGKLPEWLSDARDSMPIDRRSTLTYVDARALIDQFAPMGGPTVLEAIRELGFGNIDSYAAVTGLDESGFVNRSRLKLDGKATGLMQFANADPLTVEDLKNIPYDTPAAMSGRLDAGKLFDTYLDIMGRVEPFAADQIREGLRTAEASIGVAIRDELIGSLGDRWTLYAAPDDGGLITGWTLAVTVRDRMTLDKVHRTLIEVARGALGDDDSDPQIKQFELAGQEVYYFSVPDEDMPFLMTWCLTREEVVFGLYPQAVKGHILRKQQKSLADRPEVAKALEAENGPVALTYFDSRELFELVYPAVQMLAQYGLSELNKEMGVDLDLSVLPSAAAISKHLHPSLAIVRRTDSGTEAVTYSTIPSGSLGSSAPLMAAMLLPAVSSARTAARRSQSTNNLRQVGIAMHNYHDTYRTLPAAHNTDAEGKPLLSWRVAMLPYMEHQALYDEFHLDEPWDSEHNLKLLDRMPASFRSPQSKAGPGKTTYLAIGGEKGCFRPPAKDTGERERKNFQGGTTFAEIPDGLSNTIFVVEASDELAVEWTKPEEFEPSDMSKRLLPGMFPGGYNALMGDGSVHFLSEAIDADVLRKLFERNDGEPVDIP